MPLHLGGNGNSSLHKIGTCIENGYLSPIAIFIAIDIQMIKHVVQKKEQERPFQVRPIYSRKTLFQKFISIIQIIVLETISAHKKERGDCKHAKKTGGESRGDGVNQHH